MLRYREIYDMHQLRRRIKRHQYGGYWGKDHTYEGDRLQEFTHEPAAQTASANNLEFCLATARAHDQTLLVIKPYTIQTAGPGRDGRVKGVLFTNEWLLDHSRWLDSSSPVSAQMETTDHGSMVGFYSYRACLCLKEHEGVYDVASGRRLTNRRDIIQRMWALGFAANRGRPLAFAKLRWTGSREELELITDLADRYWNRRYESEAAKKMVSAYTSINRYAAWPGAW